MHKRLVVEFAPESTTLSDFNELACACGGTVRWIPIGDWPFHQQLIIEEAAAIVIDKVDCGFRRQEQLADLEEWFLRRVDINAWLLLLEPPSHSLEWDERHDQRVLAHAYHDPLTWEKVYSLTHSRPRRFAEKFVSQANPLLASAS